MDPSFPRFFRPALRAGGLTLLLLFALCVGVDGLPPLADPQARMIWVSDLLHQSLWLVLALLLLLLSLGEHWTSEPRLEGEPMPGLRDGLLMRVRPLLLVLAVGYLLLIPFTLVSFHAMRLRGSAVSETELAQVQRDYREIRSALDRQAGPVPSADLFARYPFLSPPRDKPRTVASLKDRLMDAELQANLGIQRRHQAAKGDLLRSSLSSTLAALIIAASLHYFWRYWPRFPLVLPPLPYDEDAG